MRRALVRCADCVLNKTRGEEVAGSFSSCLVGVLHEFLWGFSLILFTLVWLVVW